MEEASYIASKAKPLDLVVHPTVLLSIVDHYNRVARGTKKRVVGTLLGEEKDGKLHVTSSFGVPFEEDQKDAKIWFLDHNYHEELAAMYKKVNAKETIIGWYSSGPKIKPADIQILRLLRRGYFRTKQIFENFRKQEKRANALNLKISDISR